MGGTYKEGHRQLSVVSVNQAATGWSYLQFSLWNMIFPVAGPQPLSDHRGKVERGLTGEVRIVGGNERVWEVRKNKGLGRGQGPILDSPVYIANKNWKIINVASFPTPPKYYS